MTSSLIAALLASSVNADIRALTPVAWNGKADCWQMQRHNGKMKEVAAGGAKVVFIGDSITHSWETTGSKQLEKYFSVGDMKMLDLGTSADRTEHVLWRLENGELDGYEAKCVLLMIGTNNKASEEPSIDTVLGVRAILKKIREKQPKAVIVLTSIFPRGKDSSDPARKRNTVVNREIMNFCDGKTVFWCDFSDQLLTTSGELSPEIMPDYLHPSALGYEIWYAAVKPYIDYALADGKLPMPANRYSAVAMKEMFRFDEPAPVWPMSRNVEVGRKGGDDYWWMERFYHHRQEIMDSNGEIDLVLVGDSITHNWESAGREQLAELRKTYKVLCAGYGGDRVQNVLWRAEYGELDGYKAKCVMLMIGTNNSASDSADNTAAGIRKLVATIQSKQPNAKILLSPIFPRGEANDAKRKRNIEVNTLIKPLADGEKIIWLDFNDKLVDKDGDTKFIMNDRLHPGKDGYTIWTEAMMPHLRKICGK